MGACTGGESLGSLQLAVALLSLVLPVPAFARGGGASQVEVPVRIIEQSSIADLPGLDLKAAVDAVSPFALLCRADNPLPGTLNLRGSSGYSFFSPGPQADIAGALPADALRTLELFPVAGGSLGYQGRVGGSSNPQATYAALQKLLSSSKIQDLEEDPCREFFPEPGAAGPSGCTPREKSFDEKAVRVNDAVDGSIGGEGFVLWTSMPPLPFYDPGPRPGDEKPPTYGVIGSDGSFHLSLGGYTGVIQVSGASGCESYTTTEIADGGGTTTRDAGGSVPPTQAQGTPPPTPVTVSKGPSILSKPPPPEGTKLCGPDVTDYVLGTLDFLNKTYNGFDEATKDQKCTDLFNPLKADGAWEMKLFSPYDQELDAKKHVVPGTPRFFQRFTKVCARPAPCDATVEFLGHCIHAQVVNYVLWGAMNHLCDTKGLGWLMHAGRDTAISLIWNHTLSPGPVFRGQQVMTAIGEEFIKDSQGLSQKKTDLKDLLDRYYQPDSLGKELGQLEGAECTCACAKYDTTSFDNMEWGFRWGLDDWYGKRGSELSKP